MTTAKIGVWRPVKGRGMEVGYFCKGDVWKGSPAGWYVRQYHSTVHMERRLKGEDFGSPPGITGPYETRADAMGW